MPTIDDLNNIIDGMRQRAEWDLFFESINSPDWFDLLEKKNLLVPKEEIYWPQGQYLAKVAPAIPDKVLKVIKRTKTDNFRIRSDFARAILAMPVENAAKAVGVFREWLDGEKNGLLWRAAGELLERLSASGHDKAAYGLAKTLFDVGVDDTKGSAFGRKEPFAIAGGDWELGEIFKKNFPVFLEKEGVNAVFLLCDKLEKAIKLEGRPDDGDQFSDHSYIWRGSIEDSGQNHPYGIKNTFVVAIRDFAGKLLESDRSLLKEIASNLEKRKYPIFSRLALHLVRQFSAEVMLPTKFILSEKFFSSTEVWHEYALLLKEWFAKVDAVNRQRLLTKIENLVLPSYVTNDRSVEENERYLRYKKFRYLYMIREALSGSHKEGFEKLFSEFGEPDHPTFLSYRSSSWVGPESPKTLEELEEIGIAKLPEYLRTWTPEKIRAGFGPSREGLGRMLESYVAKTPQEFSNALNQFVGVEHVYARDMIDGFVKAMGDNGAGKKSPVNWGSIFEFCRWMTSQPSQTDHIDSEVFKSVQQSFSYSRITVLRFIRKIAEEDLVPIQFRKDIWDILAICITDSDPTVEKEAEYLKDRAAYDVAINATRSYAVESVILYGKWVLKHTKKNEEAGGSFDLYPEVKSVLEYHLDLKREPTLSVRSIYGLFVPQLWLLDKDWLEENIHRIFSLDNKDYFEAAFHNYLKYCSPYDVLFPIAKEAYLKELQIVNSLPYSEVKDNIPADRLAEHIMVFYARGLIELGDDMLKFAHVEMREQALSFVGRTIAPSKENPEKADRPIVERLLNYLDSRIAALKDAPASEKKELDNVTWWINSGQFPFQRILNIAQAVSDLKVAFDPSHLAFKFFHNNVARAPETIAKLVKDQVKLCLTKDWFHDYEDDIFKTLKLLLDTGNARCISLADETINILVGAGQRKFAELLSS